MRGIVVDVLQPIIDDAIAARDAIQLMQHIDHAVGVWLDYLGTRLGIERPATTDPAQDDRFGFDMAGSPFDQAPFRGDVANDALYPLARCAVPAVGQGAGDHGAGRRHDLHFQPGGTGD